MSIYSGFATRHQEQSYDECLDSVIYIIQKRLIKFYKNQSADEDKFINLLSKLHTQMKNMETHKYLQPKSSTTFDQLISFLKTKQVNEVSLKVGNRQSCFESEIESETKSRKKSKQTYWRAVQSHQKQEEIPTKSKNMELRAQTAVNKIRHPPKVSKNREESQFANKYRSSTQMRNKANSYDKNLNQKSFERQLNKNNKKKNGITARQTKNHKNFKDDETVFNNLGTDTDSADVRQLIRGYISRTKKSYLKGFNKRKQQIDSMFKNNT